MTETGMESQLEGQNEQPEPDRTTRVPRRRGLATRLAWAFGSVAVILLLILGVVLTLVSYTAQLEQIIVRQHIRID